MPTTHHKEAFEFYMVANLPQQLCTFSVLNGFVMHTQDAMRMFHCNLSLIDTHRLIRSRPVQQKREMQRYNKKKLVCYLMYSIMVRILNLYYILHTTALT
jgi:hypothetical protein